MRVAILSPMINPILEPYAGGTEAVTAQIAAGLAGRGHEITLFGSEGSRVAGCNVETLGVKPATLRWPAAPERLDGASMRAYLAVEQEVFHTIALKIDRCRTAFDIVHNNSFSGMPILLARSLKAPTVTTLHVPPILLEQAAALRAASRAGEQPRVVAVSEGLAREFETVCAVERVIHNGVSVPKPRNDAVADHLLFVGRLTHEKGADIAIAVALAAGRPLRIAGRIEDQAYFDEHIAPHIDGDRIFYLGHLGQSDVWREMEVAAAMLFTPRWPEPCSLAVLEGLARGAPAIAFALGGLPEQILHGETGFIVPAGDVRGAANAVRGIDAVSRDACRADMERRFSQTAMLDAYEQYFAEVLVDASAGLRR